MDGWMDGWVDRCTGRRSDARIVGSSKMEAMCVCKARVSCLYRRLKTQLLQTSLWGVSGCLLNCSGFSGCLLNHSGSSDWNAVMHIIATGADGCKSVVSPNIWSCW
ncbi:hypothetical protein GQ54DRAFT_223053 [Martensiomyces pterosporus]|nr:hypothetical protein GQ54DRAFT_223053 [Martensiomyces pterosporus]